MKRYSLVFGVVGSILLIMASSLVFYPDRAEAIPAFARKYRMSCTTCHAPIPRLKDYGDDFAGNGFVLKDQEAPRYFVETGDANLSLIRDFPIAVRLDGFIKHQTETGKEFDLSTPYNVKLLSGGSLAKNLAYYFYFYISERGKVVGIEDAYIMFNDLFDHDLDVYLGQFQVSDPLFKRELRLTYEDYIIYKTRIGLSQVNLAYDRGIMITYATPSSTDFVVELVNGSGIGEADGDRVFDTDKYKNFAFRIAQGIDRYVGVGGFWYYGKEKSLRGEPPVEDWPFPNPQTEAVNEMWMVGLDASVSLEKLVANYQLMFRRDDNPYFLGVKPSEEVKTDGGLLELIFLPDGEPSRWYLAGLYNWLDSDSDIDDYESITAHAGYLLRTNIRLIVEDTYDIYNEENRFVLGFVSAF